MADRQRSEGHHRIAASGDHSNEVTDIIHGSVTKD
jgi:hypothetical protein